MSEVDEIRALMGDTQVSKTDEYFVMAQCLVCYDWTEIEGTLEMHVELNGYTRGRSCRCGGAFDISSVISTRSFNPDAGKKRRPTGHKRKR